MDEPSLMFKAQAIAMLSPSIHLAIHAYICLSVECVTVEVRPHNRLSSAGLSQPTDVNSSNASTRGAAAPLGSYTAAAELDHWG